MNPDVAKIPQIIWLYKESLDLYRVGMKVPDDVTLGWTDDNYGYIRELPNAAEQKRAGRLGRVLPRLLLGRAARLSVAVHHAARAASRKR